MSDFSFKGVEFVHGLLAFFLLSVRVQDRSFKWEVINTGDGVYAFTLNVFLRYLAIKEQW